MRTIRTLKTLYLTNAREFMREPMAVFLVLLLPIVLAVFFGLVFGGDEGYTLQLGAVNEDSGPTGEQLLAGLVTDETEDMLSLHTGTRDEMEEALAEGWVSAVVVLPQDLSSSLAAGETATVKVLYDPTQPNSSGIGVGTMRTLLSEANLALSGSPRMLALEEQSVQTDTVEASDLFIPNLLGIALVWLGLFGTAMPLAQQREGQVLRRLGITPLSPVALLVGQVAWRLTVGLLQAALFLLVGYIGFGVTVTGNWLLFAGAVALGALVFICLGYFLASIARSTEGVMAALQLVNFPLMFLSGSLFPIETLPDYFRPVANAMPLTYVCDALRQTMAGAPALHPLWLDFAVMGGWLVVLVVLTAKFWRWE